MAKILVNQSMTKILVTQCSGLSTTKILVNNVQGSEESMTKILVINVQGSEETMAKILAKQ